MKIDEMVGPFEHVELFGKPALLTGYSVDPKTVPKGWHYYELRGSDDNPGIPVAIEVKADANHAGTILCPEAIDIKAGSLDEGLKRLGKRFTLAEFCKAHDLTIPDDPVYLPRPARPDEADLFFAMTPETDQELGCIGHVRMDFGYKGKEFWHTWHPRGPEELNSQEFKTELDEVVNSLRETVLSGLVGMQSYCYHHGGKIDGGWVQNYGYVVETEHYLYYLRCNPVKGDYNSYLSCFSKQAQEMYQAQGPNQGQEPEAEHEPNRMEPAQDMTMGGM